MRLRIITILAFLFLIAGCKSISHIANQSRFITGGEISVGISVSEFLSSYGEPQMRSFFYDSDSIFHEKLEYKELVYDNHIFYTVNSVFEFQGHKLVSQQQEAKERHTGNCNCNE